MTESGAEVVRLVWELRSRNPLVRGRSASALGLLGQPEAVLPLVELLRDPDEGVRCRTAEALGRLRDPRSARALATALQDTQPAVQAAVQSALVLQGSAAVRALCEAVWSGGPSWRLAAEEVLVRIGLPAVPTVIRLLNAPVWEVRREATAVLGRIGDRAATPALVIRLTDETAWVRAQAAEALGWIGDPEAINALTRQLQDSSDVVRLQAVRALGAILRWKCVDPFLPLLTDPAEPVREAAAVELGRQGDAKAALPLVRALEAGLRAPVAEALGQIAARDPAPELRAALPVLRSLLSPPDPKWDALYRATITQIEQATAAFQDLPLPSGTVAPPQSLPRPSAPKPAPAAPLTVDDELEQRAETTPLAPPPDPDWKQRAAGYVGRKLRGT